MHVGVNHGYQKMTLSLKAKQRLQDTVKRLTADCVNWYKDDGEVIEQMGTEDLEKMVTDYLSKRDWYRQ